MSDPIRVYISGPMTGYPEFNRTGFDRAASHWRKTGADVFNPADNEPGKTREEYMRMDLAAVTTCDLVIALPGWEQSQGATAELVAAVEAGIHVMEENEGAWAYVQPAEIRRAARDYLTKMLDDAFAADPAPEPPCHPSQRFVTKDSGERQQFTTGAQRDTQDGKVRWDLVPPLAMKRVAELYARGAEKYNDWNWAKGISMSRCYASGLRHLMQWVLGDRDEDHLAAVVFNVLCLMHYEETGRTDLDDMAQYRGNGAA